MHGALQRSGMLATKMICKRCGCRSKSDPALLRRLSCQSGLTRLRPSRSKAHDVSQLLELEPSIADHASALRGSRSRRPACTVSKRQRLSAVAAPARTWTANSTDRFLPHSFARLMALPDSREVMLERWVDERIGQGHRPADAAGKHDRWPSLAYPTDRQHCPQTSHQLIGQFVDIFDGTCFSIRFEPAWRT